MNRKLIHYLGLLGPISIMSYVAAILLAPVAYPGYDWMSQAVSDLSAQDAPSRMLWQQLATLYNLAGIVSITLVCVYIENRLTRKLRIGIYLFGVMSGISAIGYSMFPLSTSGHPSILQDFIHVYVVTGLVVFFSVLSLLLIIIGGYHDRDYRSLSIWAAIFFMLMLAGAVGTGAAPAEYFGLAERLSVLSPTAFNAVLGIYLFNGFDLE